MALFSQIRFYAAAPPCRFWTQVAAELGDFGHASTGFRSYTFISIMLILESQSKLVASRGLRVTPTLKDALAARGENAG